MVLSSVIVYGLFLWTVLSVVIDLLYSLQLEFYITQIVAHIFNTAHVVHLTVII